MSRHSGGFLAVLSGGVLVAALTVSAGDWPTYRHDAARSGITPEAVKTPLAACWVFRPLYPPEQAWGEPNPRPVGGGTGAIEGRRLQYDDAFHVAVAGGSVYFGSSADGKVYALDTATGRIRWTVFTGGPVRMAPTVWQDKVYVGSDDGFAYCLRATDGREVWRFRAGPGDRQLLGSGKMISPWALRTGVLVDKGVAYFGAGIFPTEGVYLFAVAADNGQLIWCYDSGGDPLQSTFSPQGYLLASKSKLFVPEGRVSPASFDRKSGRPLDESHALFSFQHAIGGPYAVLDGDRLFTGTEEIAGYNPKTGDRFAWLSARQIAIAADRLIMANGRELQAVDRKIYPEAALHRRTLSEDRQVLLVRWNKANDSVAQKQAAARQSELVLKAVDQQIAALAGKPVPPALQGERNAAAGKADADRKALEAARQQPILKEMQEADKALADADAALPSSVKWRCPTTCAESLILAGNRVIAGGTNQVIAVDAATGNMLWTADVDGMARGLAVADGRLFVSTAAGSIYCFGPVGSQNLGEVRPVAQPWADDEFGAVCKAAAERILRTSGATRGYALVLGSGTGRLAYELALQSKLTIYGVESDPVKVAASRKALDATGLYGKRVRIDHVEPDRLPYSDYFANLVVSETALADGRAPGNAREVFRVLKPLGGALVLGQSAAAGKAGALTAAALRQWRGKTDLKSAQVTEQDGAWLAFTRGALPGAGAWTHHYANAGNTTCSDDQLVKCPLSLLWFGEPGPEQMADRHMRPISPLAANGRMFIQGEGVGKSFDGRNVILCYDAYNGIALWERTIPGALRLVGSADGGNVALGDDSLFLAAGGHCDRLDAATGETRRTYELPAPSDGIARRWGYVAVVGDRLFGSRGTRSQIADGLFAMDIASGDVVWQYESPAIQQSAVAIGDGKLFLAHANVTAEQRKAVMQELTDRVKTLTGAERVSAERGLQTANARIIVALDAATGKQVWSQPFGFLDADLPSPGNISLGTICTRGVLLVFGVYTDGHLWEQFYEGQFAARRITALSTRDGHVLWSKNIGYRVRPLVVGDTLHAEPWAYDLHTGEQKMRIHPVTGRPEPWLFPRPGHHCGAPAAGPNLLIFRSWALGWYDLQGDYGVDHFSTLRTSCWINFIPANGLLMVPEGGSGCLCAFPNSCTVVFAPSAETRQWAWYGAQGSLTPVRHLALNLGAPGDRRDKDGTLWLGYPRPSGHLVLGFHLDTVLRQNTPWFSHDPARLDIAGTDKPWLFASGLRGMQRMLIPLVGDGEGTAQYTVRLAFSSPESTGRHAFDIKLMDRTVQSNVDLAKETGGRNRALIKQFTGVRVHDKLLIEFGTKTGNPPASDLPVLHAIEIVREKVLSPGIVLPAFELQDARPESRAAAVIANNADDTFTGEVRFETPAGFTIEPASAPLTLAAGQTVTNIVTARAVQKGVAAVHAVPIRFMRKDGSLAGQGQTQIKYLGTQSAEWQPLDLTPFANRPLWGEDAWIGMSLTQVPPGEAEYAGTPFRIIDQVKNNDFACIALRSKRVRSTRGKEVPASVEIPVGRRARAIYFLHGCGWVTSPDSLPFGQYEMVYEDGTSATVPLVAFGSKPEGPDLEKRRAISNIQDWWPTKYPPLSNERVKPAVVYTDRRYESTRRYLYVLEWVNPAPDKVVRVLRLSADPTKDPSVLILGISLRAIP